MEAKIEEMINRAMAAQAAKFEEQLRQQEARYQEQLRQQEARYQVQLLQQEVRYQEELRKARAEKEEKSDDIFTVWERHVLSLRNYGYEFDERDIASLSVEYRKSKNITPRFCDGNDIEPFSTKYLLDMVSKLTRRSCPNDVIELAVIMYLNRYYALVRGLSTGGDYYKTIADATNKEDKEAKVKVCRYIPKASSSIAKVLNFSVNGLKASTTLNNSPWRLTFETVGMNCGEPNHDMLNLFTPHPYFLELKKASKQQLKALAHEAKAWEELLWDLMGDKAAYEYSYNWLAHLVQFPGVKMGVILCMYGPKGIGKNTLLRPLQILFGRHYLETAAAGRDVFEGFNELLADKLIINLNEATNGKKEHMGMLKHLTTDSEIVINIKNMSKYSQPNILNFIITSNEDWIVPAEEDERRYAFFKLKGRYSGSSTPEKERYFSRIKAVPVKAVLAALLLRDLSKWNPREIPKTDALRHQQSRGMTTTRAFWETAMKNDNDILGTAYLTDGELLKYNLAHKKPKSGMGFDDNQVYELIPGIKPGLRSAASEEKYGIPRADLRMGGRTNEVTLYWSYLDEDGKLKRCSLQKELIWKVFDQWQNKNRAKPKHQDEATFWKYTLSAVKLIPYRPKIHGESKRPVSYVIPTQQEARDYFAKHFMKDEGYFHTYEYELLERQIVEEYEYQSEILEGEDRKALDERFETQMKELKEKYGRLEADEWDADEEKELPQLPAPSNSDLFNIYTNDPEPPVKSKPPTPKPATRIAKEVGEIPCAQKPMTPKLSKSVSKLIHNENGRLSIAATPKSDPAPESQEKSGKYTFVKSGRSFQRQQEATPEPNPPISVSSKKLPLGIAVPDTQKRFRFPRTVQQCVTVGDYEESDDATDESDDAADESDDADD